VAKSAKLHSDGRRRAHPVDFAIVAALVSEYGDSWLPACTGNKQFCFSPLVRYGTKGRFPVIDFCNLNKSVLRHHRLVGFVSPLGRWGMELTEKDAERRIHEIALANQKLTPGFGTCGTV
jgi:hypothetical protein